MARNKFNTRKKTSWSTNVTPELLEKVQKKAFELYEKRGCSHGNDISDWLEAERIVLAKQR